MRRLIPPGKQNIDGPAGTLELVVELPFDSVLTHPIVAIVCHQLPTAGGTMDNKVVTTIAKSFRGLGLTALRFNFRGVGGSAGAFDNGHGEHDDLAAVVAWVRSHDPAVGIVLAGFRLVPTSHYRLRKPFTRIF